MHGPNIEELKRWVEYELNSDGKTAFKSVEILEPKILDVFRSYVRFEFAPRNFLATQAELDKRSAFMKQYFIESSQNFEIAFKNALTAYYSAAFSMLRNFLESVIVGAMCEYLAHDCYRSNHKGINSNLIKKIESLSTEKKNNIEDKSFMILPVVWEFLASGNKKFNIKELVMALDNWGAIYPITKIDEIYNLYGELSGFIHQNPIHLDTTQRAIASDSESMYEVIPIQENLSDFCDMSCKILDAAIVIELNIMKEFVTGTLADKIVLEDQLRTLNDDNLPLPFTKQLLSELSK